MRFSHEAFIPINIIYLFLQVLKFLCCIRKTSSNISILIHSLWNLLKLNYHFWCTLSRKPDSLWTFLYRTWPLRSVMVFVDAFFFDVSFDLHPLRIWHKQNDIIRNEANLFFMKIPFRAKCQIFALIVLHLAFHAQLYRILII